MGDKQDVVLSRSGEIKIVDPETGKVFTLPSTFPTVVPSTSRTGRTSRRATVIVEWDPYNAVIISEFKGVLPASSDIDEGVTFRTERDDQTGFEEKVVIETRDRKKIPTIYDPQQRW